MTTATEIRKVENPEQVESMSLELSNECQAVTVTDEASHNRAGDLLKAIKAAKESVDHFLGDLRRDAHALWKKAKDRENEALDPLKKAERHLKSQVGNYARKLHEIEMAERREKEQAAIKKAEEERLKLADKFVQRGESEEVIDELLDMPLKPKVERHDGEKKPKGISTRTTIKMRITNPDAVPREFCVPDESAIRAFGKATKGKKSIPGVEFYEDTITSVR